MGEKRRKIEIKTQHLNNITEKSKTRFYLQNLLLSLKKSILNYILFLKKFQVC